MTYLEETSGNFKLLYAKRNKRERVYLDTSNNTVVKFSDHPHIDKDWFELYTKFQLTDKRFIEVQEFGWDSSNSNVWIRMPYISEPFTRFDVLLSDSRIDIGLKRKIFGEMIDMFGSFMKFDCGKQIFVNEDLKAKNVIYTESGIIRALDPNECILKPMNENMHFLAMSKAYLEAMYIMSNV